MNYEPQARPAHGFQPLLRPAMSAICDVCGKSRTRKGGHDKCSKVRQAAGFVIVEGVKRG